MKLLIDMNLSPRWIETLADAGFQAVLNHNSYIARFRQSLPLPRSRWPPLPR